MNQSDIEFTMGLDTSPAEQKLNKFQQRIRSSVVQEMSDLSGAPKGITSGNKFLEASKIFDIAAQRFALAAEKLRLQNDRADANRLYKSSLKNEDSKGMQTATEKYVAANEGLKSIREQEKALTNQEKALKVLDENELKEEEITNETKEQSKEFNLHHIKLGKTLTILGMIKTAIEAIKKLWGQAFETRQNFMKEHGFFASDPTAALQSMSQYTHARLVAGERAMGKAAPFSMADFDERTAAITALRTKALRGEGIADDQYVIAMQRVFSRWGVGLNAHQLLTDGSISTTDVMKKMLIALEDKILPNLNKLSAVDRELAIGDLEKIFGTNLLNAITAHATMRKVTGGPTAVEEQEGHGGGVYTNLPRIKNAYDLTSAFSDMKTSVELLNTAIANFTTGPMVGFTTGLAGLTEFLAAFISDPIAVLTDAHLRKKLLDKVGSTMATVGVLLAGPEAWVPGLLGLAISNAVGTDSKQGKTFNTETGANTVFQTYFNRNKTWRAVSSATLDNPSNAYSFLGAAIKQDPQFAAGNETWLENIRKKAVEEQLYQAYVSGTLGQLASQGGDIGTLAKMAQKIPQGMWRSSFISALENKKDFSSFWQKITGAGGSQNIKLADLADENLGYYLLSGLSGQAIKTFINESLDPKQFGERFKSARVHWEDKNGDGFIGEGEAWITLHYNDIDNTDRTVTVPLQQRYTNEAFNY